MARTPSNMLPLGTELIDFSLFDTVSGIEKSLFEYKSERPILIMFICNHCPFVIHLHQGLQDLVRDYKGRIDFVAISSNDVDNYPDDRPELMTKLFAELDFHFPYFYDESQDVAKSFDAACTPDFYLFGSDNSLVYRGQFDDSRPGNNLPVTGKDLREAIDQTLIGKQILDQNQKPSLGCNIKWK